MPSSNKQLSLSTCSQCGRARNYNDMYDCLMNDGEKVCEHCFTYQIAVRKELQLSKTQLNKFRITQ